METKEKKNLKLTDYELRASVIRSEYIDTGGRNALEEFTNRLAALLTCKPETETIIICIGSDRTTGDCFGPIVGHMLSGTVSEIGGVQVIGTLEKPIHAKNVADVKQSIYRNGEKPLVIAVDACLGRIEHVGHIGIGMGAVRPGAGLGKSLPEIGDIYITGVVNFGGVMNFEVLRNTRLGLVYRMSETAYQGIAMSLRKWKG